MAKSLRRSLMLWLLGPLLALFMVGTGVVYQLGLADLEEAYDRALYASAMDIFKVAQASVSVHGQLQLPGLAREILLSDPYDKIYFSILDERGALIAGDGRLPAPSPEDEDEGEENGTAYYDTAVNGEDVRAIVMAAELPGHPEKTLRIMVGETRHKREMLAKDIVNGFVFPQALMMLLAAVVVMLGVGRGLAPLNSLRAALARRSHQDMRGLETAEVPVEAQPLVREINSLLERLAAVFDSQKHFIADAAHQLRTPLAGLAAQIDFARFQSNPPQTAHALESAKVVSDRLNHAVTQLLSLARNEAGSGKPSELVALDLTDFARGVAADWVERAVEHGIDLGFDGDDAVMVMADAERLREALDNLIDNALKYCPRGSAMTIRTLPQTLVVEDDGPGIPLDEREHIFERFHRLLGNGQEGSGLGLAIVQEIVEAHHATISVHAAATGGSVFTIRFPAPEQKAG